MATPLQTRQAFAEAFRKLFVQPFLNVQAAKAKAKAANQVPGPIALPQTGGDPLENLRRRRKRSGRAGTILAGDMAPLDLGRRTLLG